MALFPSKSKKKFQGFARTLDGEEKMVAGRQVPGMVATRRVVEDLSKSQGAGWSQERGGKQAEAAK